MPKFLVHANEINYYLSTEIEADNKDQAEEKYLEMIEEGEIEVNKSEIVKTKAELIKD